MMNADRCCITLTGKVVGTAELDETRLGHRAEYRGDAPGAACASRQMPASARHDTKTRGEVRGGGRKPWRQKGTGRARQGSIRSPQWIGGGVVFGPHPRSYTQEMPSKMRRLAVRSALSAKLRDERLTVVQGLAEIEPKTKAMKAIIEQLPESRARC